MPAPYQKLLTNRYSMLAVIYGAVMLTLILIDSATTAYLSSHIKGKELNPFIDSDSFWGVLFSPVRLSLFFLCYLTVWFSEKHIAKLIDIVKRHPEIKVLFIIPYTATLFITFAVFNNTMIILGINGPISWFVSFFENKVFGAIVLYGIFSLIFYPLSEIFFDRRYLGNS